MKRVLAAFLAFLCVPAFGAEIPDAAPTRLPAGAPELLAAGGLVLEHSSLGLGVTGTLADSLSQSIGLRPEDRLLYLNGKKTDTVSDVVEALSSWAPRTRLSAVVERSLGVSDLESALPAPRAPAPRDALVLTPSEQRLRDAALAAADREVPDRVQRLRTPLFKIAAGEKVWIRFPKGIPAGVAAGDVLEGATSTAMATDSKLDFVAIPAGSLVWAQVLSVSEIGSAKLVKLHVFKLRLKNGHTYPCSGIISDVSGDQGLLKVSPGGTVVGAPAEGDSFLADPARSLQVWFLQPLSIHEADAFFTAGPGLWFKTFPEGAKHSFEVTHVISRRSADAAGIKVGDLVTAIDGTPASKLGFPEAIDRLYGPAGSSVRLRVRRRSEPPGEEEHSLLRGALYRKGVGLGFSRQGDGTVVVTKVYPRSAAQIAGLREGDILISFGQTDVRQLDEKRINETLKADLAGDKELSWRTPGREPRKASIPSGLFPGLIKVEAALYQAQIEK